MRVPGSVAAVLLAVLVALLVWRASQSSERQLEIVAVCEAVGAERYEEAIALSQSGVVGGDADGRIAAECRCWALLNLGLRDECAGLIDSLLQSEEASDWIPHPVLASLVVRTRQSDGRIQGAARLAAAAAKSHPENLKLLELEIDARSRMVGQERALAEVEGRLTNEVESLPLRIALAVVHARRADGQAALRVLGDRAPPREHPLRLAWLEERARALAQRGDGDAVREHFELWAALDGDTADLRARYALRMSIAQLPDPDHEEIELLKNALARQSELQEPRLLWALYRRLIAALVNRDQVEEALRIYDAASASVAFPDLTREEIERSALAVVNAEAPAAAGELVFRLAPGTEEAGELWVSPVAASAPDSKYEIISMRPGSPASVHRRPAVTPQRWVFRDGRGRTRASGAVWPRPGGRSEVEILPGPPVEARRPRLTPGGEAQRPAADGRRRLFAFILDCGDWRLLQYLRARGELPFLDQLLHTGYRAVLESNPAFTAAAMEALVWPRRAEQVSFIGLMQRLGLELGGLASVGDNPLGFLSAVLPRNESLFERIGAGERVAANLLFSHGGIKAGHHAEVLGPAGERGRLALPNAYRALTPSEREAFPSLAADPSQLRKIETIAAELDTALGIIDSGEVDFLMLRVEALDLLTHAWFRGLLEAGQDDGKSPLLETYRYIDARLESIHQRMDGDDLMVVMSDHGIRTPMEHETDAVFVLSGDGVPHGRATGMPHLRGVPRVLASLVGVETAWPDEGLAPWSETSAGALARRVGRSGASR
jgi:hypothetical protein